MFNSKKKDASNRPLLNHELRRPNNNKARLVLTASALAFFGTTCVYLSNHLPAVVLTNVNNQNLPWHESTAKVVSAGISLNSFEYGLNKCQDTIDLSQAKTNTTRTRHRNPRRAPEATDILIQNGHIWLGDRYLEGGDVYLKDGLIAAIGKGLKVDNKHVRVINAGGRVVTPGVIDMHSHMAVGSLGGLTATDDVNEMTSPTTPYVSVSDTFLDLFICY